MKEDWRDLGDHIRNIVQDAVNSQDFRKLDQTIKNTLSDAVDDVAESFRFRPGRRGAETGRQAGRPPLSRRPGSGGAGHGRTGYGPPAPH